MCYYATTDFLCGDWKWGNMMLRCPRQHRIGETCGAKLVHHESVTKSPTICKICDEINTKQRRLSRTQDSISRWSKEPDKFTASLERAQREAGELEDKIKDLHLRRPSVATSIAGASLSPGPSRGGSAASGTTLPPVRAMTSPAYEITSGAAPPRRQEASSYSTPRHGVLPATSSNGAGQMVSPYPASYANRNAAPAVTPQGATYQVSYTRR